MSWLQQPHQSQDEHHDDDTDRDNRDNRQPTGLESMPGEGYDEHFKAKQYERGLHSEFHR